MVHGQVNLYDAVRRQVDFTLNGKSYALRTDRTLPTLIARARGWHLDEAHLTVDGQPIAGALFDFGLYFFHNAQELVRRGTGPYFYLPKMESHLEARLWNDVFNVAQDVIRMRRGTIRATVLIETILAAFEMDEILYELRDHSAGLNCGRWDYIFSVVKTFRQHPGFVLPDRADVTMTAAQIPIKEDPKANEAAMERVRADKLREVKAGHDGTWVAHPALASIAVEIFNKHMPTPNQMFVRREDVEVSGRDLIDMNIPGKITEEGVRQNLAIGLGYIEGWLRGVGCVPINYLMVCPFLTSYGFLEIAHTVNRKTLLQPRSAAASYGSGAGMVLALRRDAVSTRRTRSVCSESKRTVSLRRRQLEINLRRQRSSWQIR